MLPGNRTTDVPPPMEKIRYTTLSGFSDEWVGAGFSRALWESINNDITIPLDGDPSVYKVATSSGEIVVDNQTSTCSHCSTLVHEHPKYKGSCSACGAPYSK